MFNDVLLRNPIVLNPTEKKKPHNIQIKNFNPNEPKVKQSIKYTAKQNFRRYKTLKEPYLLSKIKIDEDAEMVNKIQEAFGIKPKAKPNYTDIKTATLPNSQGLAFAPPTVEPKIGESIFDDDGKDAEYRAFIRDAKKLIDEHGTRTFFPLGSVPDGAWEELKPYMYEAEAKIKARNEEMSRKRDEDVVKIMEELRIREEEEEVFEYTSSVVEDVMGEAMIEAPLLDLSNPPEDDVEDKPLGEREKAEIEIFGSLATPTKTKVALSLTSPLMNKYLDDFAKSGKEKREERKDSLSEKTTEAGSVALEAEREEALKRRPGRPPLMTPQAIERREKEELRKRNKELKDAAKALQGKK